MIGCNAVSSPPKSYTFSKPHIMLRVALSACLFLLFIACHTAKQPTTSGTDVLNASGLQPVGRTRITPGQQLELISSAVHFTVQFQDTACDVYASLPSGMDHNYLQYELDGEYQKRLRVNGGAAPLHISVPAGTHTLTLYKATEAQTGAIFIQKLVAHSIQSVAPATAPVIEFIGNSITCGAAADPSEVPCGTGVYHDQHNAYMAYGPRVARALGVNFIMSSVSGIGMYRNWNSDGPTMPQVYEKTGLQMDDKDAWAFEKYSPQVVSIALGTNDFSKGDGKRPRLPFDSAAFVSQYIDFVRLVQRNYPQTQIALLSSPMVHDSARTQLQNCLTAVKNRIDALAGSKPIALYFFEPMKARGCSGHPNVEDHAQLADQLLPFFKTLLSK
jgi:hypothetical protein